MKCILAHSPHCIGPATGEVGPFPWNVLIYTFQRNNRNLIFFSHFSNFKMSERLVLKFDGANRGSTGRSGAGGVIYRETRNEKICIDKYYVPLPTGTTNNEAEYIGLIEGVKRAKLFGKLPLLIQGDSMLVVNQVNGSYQVKANNLKILNKEALEALKDLDYTLEHIYRKYNSEADEMANLACDTNC